MVVEYQGKRYSVVGGTKTSYLVTKPWDEEEGEAFFIPKNESKVIAR